jgi:adenosylmethionine-8-amino-7-oxononanoate aminotransferase
VTIFPTVSTSEPTGGSGLPLVENARGCYLYDAQGRDYLDGSSGVLNVNVGHSHPAVLSAIRDQLDRVAFVHRAQFDNTPARDLTKRLLQIAPKGSVAVEYSNSGSEANECALRLVFVYHHRRHNPERTVVLSEQPSYHQMTAEALAITGLPSSRDPSMAGLVANAEWVLVHPQPGNHRANRNDWAEAILRIGASRIAAIVVQPLGGASFGAAPISLDTLQWLREETEDKDIVLVADEMASGFGRTGRWWASDHAGIAPDILTAGKGVAGGYTSLAVTIVAERIRVGIGGSLGQVVCGHTMSANPLACAASCAVLDVVINEDLLSAARVRGDQLTGALDRLIERHHYLLAEHTGRGLMRGLHLVPNAAVGTSRRILSAARDNGLVLCAAGTSPSTQALLVAPPLMSSADDIVTLEARLDAALHQLWARRRHPTAT